MAGIAAAASRVGGAPRRMTTQDDVGRRDDLIEEPCSLRAKSGQKSGAAVHGPGYREGGKSSDVRVSSASGVDGTEPEVRSSSASILAALAPTPRSRSVDSGRVRLRRERERSDSWIVPCGKSRRATVDSASSECVTRRYVDDLSEPLYVADHRVRTPDTYIVRTSWRLSSPFPRIPRNSFRDPIACCGTGASSAARRRRRSRRRSPVPARCRPRSAGRP
jgi:hypothetical protein